MTAPTHDRAPSRTQNPRSGHSIPRYALNRAEAAESLGMSLDSFKRYVQPEVRVVRRGRLRLVPVSELERWAAENADALMIEQVGS